ncbi:MAG: hypothetical protein RLZZ292_661 [Bacteroidota bacterium]
MFRFSILFMFTLFYACSTKSSHAIETPIYPKNLAVVLAYDYKIPELSNAASGVADVLEQKQKIRQGNILFFSMSNENQDFNACKKKMQEGLRDNFFKPDALLFIILQKEKVKTSFRVDYLLANPNFKQPRKGNIQLPRSIDTRRDGQQLAWLVSSKMRLE